MAMGGAGGAGGLGGATTVTGISTRSITGRIFWCVTCHIKPPYNATRAARHPSLICQPQPRGILGIWSGRAERKSMRANIRIITCKAYYNLCRHRVGRATSLPCSFIFPIGSPAMQPPGKALHYNCNKGMDMSTPPMPKYRMKHCRPCLQCSTGKPTTPKSGLSGH